MPAKLIIHVHPGDRVEVRVEGLTQSDEARAKGKKLCDRVTRRVEQDLGLVVHREYEDDENDIVEQERLKLSES